MSKKKYKYRAQALYKGIKIDVVANDLKTLQKRVERKKKKIDNTFVSDDITLNAWKERWLDTYKQNIQYKTLSDYRTMLKHIDFDIPISAVKPLQLQEIFNRHTNKSKSFLHKLYILANDMFEQAFENNLVERNPMRKVKIPKGYSKERRPLTDEERFYFIEVAKTHYAGKYFMLQLYAGLRPSEAARVRGKDISANGIKVNGSKTENATRIVPLVDELKEILGEMQPNELVATNSYGNPLSKSSMRNAWESFRRELNIEMGCEVFRNALIEPLPLSADVVPYCLRHTFSTDCVTAGVPFAIKEQILGHSLKHLSLGYDHLTLDSVEVARKALNKYHEKRNRENGSDNDIKPLKFQQTNVHS